jgi:hypothetical protein
VNLPRATLLLCFMLACGTACAAEPAGGAPAATLPPVRVDALRDPVEKSYRKIVRGMVLYEERRSLAPSALLKFRILPRTRDVNLQGLQVSIVGETVSIPVTVNADNTFALERSQQAFEEDALVMTNRRARSMTWRADVRTPGVPPDTRRLGDLRLECLVGMESDLVSNLRQPWFGRIDNPLLRRQGFCEKSDVRYYFFAERPLFGVTLVSGSRREILPVDRLYGGISRDPTLANDLEYCDCQVLLDRTYYVPLGDRSWPDDTLVMLDYMDTMTSPQEKVISPPRARGAVAPGKSTKADVIAALGAGQVIRFDSGYEAWIYRLANEAEGGKRSGERGKNKVGEEPTDEVVVLFAPSGRVARTRIRGEGMK